MLRGAFGFIWRHLPPGVRRWSMRATQARFTVTAAAIILDNQGQVLLLKHRFRAGSGWGMPGGFIKPGEQPEEALRRELQEETGLRLETLQIFAARSFKRPRQIEIVYLGRANARGTPQSIEIETLGWFRPDSLPSGLPFDQQRLIERAVANGANAVD
ncbi:MAG: NUDIX hydrolase [Pyrinomonadaceae bacterium]